MKQAVVEKNDDSLCDKNESSADSIGLTGKSQSTAEGTRNNLAMIYVVGYLIIIVAILAIGTFKNWSTDDYKDLLLAASGVLSGPLGFIVGYYFKTSKENE